LRASPASAYGAGEKEAHVELQQVLESTATIRFYRQDPIPDALLASILDAGRWAPSGGNRQPVRFIAVRDAGKRGALKQLYLPLWNDYAAMARQGADTPSRRRLIDNADHFAQHLDEVPVLLVVCALEAALMATDRGLDRLSIVGGASVYPAVQNVLLKAREVGLGTALTTLLCAVEPKVKDLLGIPAGFLTAATIALGYPARGFPSRTKRRPLADIAFAEQFGRPLVS
jgi:nitroreductase